MEKISLYFNDHFVSSHNLLLRINAKIFYDMTPNMVNVLIEAIQVLPIARAPETIQNI